MGWQDHGWLGKAESDYRQARDDFNWSGNPAAGEHCRE